ncbi:two-component system chemotaxis response regulator CheB [Saccharothrix coeruleofusca]|uniref:chemotaxis protein CheB n=1 Tax=Saccharothrix coeruleofusca TaxID=33919 RepID=UPI001AEBA48F|nr:chemotaxis protein CheB [Saccharothrix coeruleofusca]MBP2337587.1 two-component system chemotaxis response regulator CheB [Saccharothrix coeruleofusca]
MSATAHGPVPPGFQAVAMIASLGGLHAVSEVLRGLPADFPAPVVVVQHGRREADGDRLGRLLARVTPLPVRTARTGDPLGASGVVVVPTGHCAVLGPDRTITLAEGPALRSGDQFLTSLAATLGQAVIGVVLTGMLDDGARGVREVKRGGGRVLVQDPTTARAPGMPASAMATGCVDFVLPLNRIAAALVALTMAPGGADLLRVPIAPWARLHA